MSDAAIEETVGLVLRLQSNLLFSLSLGSKELFHTNLLAWVAEHRQDLADTLLQLWSGESAADTAVRARREWNHLDLVLSDVLSSGHERVRVVVENKMFSLPDLAQLEKYGTVVRRLGGSPALILLSLADPGWPDGSWTDSSGLRWQHCSYRTLAEAIDCKPLGQGDYVDDTVQQWQSTRPPVVWTRDDQVAGRARLAAQSGWATFDLPVFTRPPFAGSTPHPVAPDGTAGFGRFSPDFAYRYLKLDNITLNEATDAGVAIIRHAASLRNEQQWHV